MEVVSKWEQLQHACFMNPGILRMLCAVITLCFIILYLHKRIQKRGGKYKDYRIWGVFCGGVTILSLISFFSSMPQQVEPYQLHEASGVLHFSSGRYISPYFTKSDGERWSVDFSPCIYHTKIINLWKKEITVFYVITKSGDRYVYQLEYQGKLICSLEDVNSYIWIWRLDEFIKQLGWIALLGVIYFLGIEQALREESNQE